MDYNHKKIEKKWQEKWAEEGMYDTSDKVESKDNFYTLVEFPYPSGDLHVGHWYAFAVTDIFARYKRMKGHNVLYPIGFDAFGLPAENAAIKRGLNPADWTEKNIEFMKEQFDAMGGMFDWSRKVSTTDPEYYKWTQWIITKFFEEGLLYKSKATVNWCPSCQTVLANEQVVGGLCERCDTEVEKREMDDWKLAISDYAQRLLDDLDTIDWPSEIKESQRNWIGRSEGAIIKFKVESEKFKEEIKVFTTRPDTLFGATYLVLAPEHEFVQEQILNPKSEIRNKSEIEKYLNKTKKKTEIERTAEGKEKTGVEIEGIKATNPATGEKVPIWVADYVLSSVGTGAIMAVPAHDERDFEFAKKYNLEIRRVVEGGDLPYLEEGELVNSEEFDGMKSEEVREKITEKYGEKKVTYRLRDWSVGRQRYWGTPMPIVYDPKGDPHPVSIEYLPWHLPQDVDFKPTGKPPLAKSEELKERTEKIFGEGWTPAVETLDTFVDSSWYFLRYLDPQNEKEFSSKEKQEMWMPVDLYSGGAEHTTLHLLYSRFFQKFLYDQGLATEHEPYKRRLNRGLILGPDGRKMSKSKGNVINPDEVVERLGSDTVRTYLAFVGPYNEAGSYPWDPDGVVGVRRFLERVWKIKERVSDDGEIDEILFNQTIKKVGDEIESLKLNTGVSQLMTILNDWEKLKNIPKAKFKVFLKLLAPYAPYIAEELWHEMGEEKSIHLSLWPDFDESKLQSEDITLAVQVNGKVRGEIEIKKDTSEEEVKEIALNHPVIDKWVPSRGDIKKVIYVPEKLVNIVV